MIVYAFLYEQKEKSSTDQADQSDHVEVIKKPKTLKVTPAVLYSDFEKRSVLTLFSLMPESLYIFSELFSTGLGLASAR